MKFEKITDITIKIILSDEDMKLNNVSAENIFSNSASSKMFLQKLLNKAEKEIGFEPGDSRLLVEAIMSSDIEYTFTITKFDENKMYLEKSNNLFIFKFTYFDDFVASKRVFARVSPLDKLHIVEKMSLIHLISMDF